MGESCETARGSLTHSLSIWFARLVLNWLLVFGPKPVMTLWLTLSHQIFVVYGQVSFVWSITTLLAHENRSELDIWLSACSGDLSWNLK